MAKVTARVDAACRVLRQAIIEQALVPGTKLPEDEIGRHFQMSRTLVRGALARLKSEGLVDAQPKRTATVARPTLKEAEEVFHVRRVLEREAVRLVVERWRPELRSELEAHVREEEAAKAAGDERVSIRLAGEFHSKLASMSGNELLHRYVAEVVSRCSVIVATFARRHSAECAINEHRAIIEALARRDAAAAVALMDEHVGSVERRAFRTDQSASSPDLMAILSAYASVDSSGGAVGGVSTARREVAAP
jgi:DNA-binding GntR family transcriptional regulator